MLVFHTPVTSFRPLLQVICLQTDTVILVVFQTPVTSTVSRLILIPVMFQTTVTCTVSRLTLMFQTPVTSTVSRLTLISVVFQTPFTSTVSRLTLIPVMFQTPVTSTVSTETDTLDASDAPSPCAFFYFIFLQRLTLTCDACNVPDTCYKYHVYRNRHLPVIPVMYRPQL